MAVAWVSIEQGQPMRNRLAQLCRGYLVLSDRDPAHAEGYLQVFLRELAKDEDSAPEAASSAGGLDRGHFGRRPPAPGFEGPGVGLAVGPGPSAM